MRPIGTGEVSFGRMIEQNCFYVDKTDFIRQWWNEKKLVTLITRPRRFGKTMTLSMVDTFFSPLHYDDIRLFEHLFIYRDSDLMALQGKIPVISLTFSSLKADSFVSFLTRFSMTIATLYGKFDFLSEALSKSDRKLFEQLSDKGAIVPSGINQPEDFSSFVSRLTFSLQWLSEWLHKYYGEKVLILLDEYDTPLIEAYMKGFYEDAAIVI